MSYSALDHIESLARTESASLTVAVEPSGGQITWKLRGRRPERICFYTPTTLEELASAMLERLSIHMEVR